MSDKDEFVLSVGQAQEIEFALRRNGFDTALVKVMTIGNNLSLFRKVLLCQAVVTDVEHLIDLDADPFVPEGWKVEEHQKGGQFKWGSSKAKLYLSKKQTGGSIVGNKLRQELKGKSVYNANLLDYLLANPHLIPEDWKGKMVFFWGTIYRSARGGFCVRYLYWNGVRWRWESHWLVNLWLVNYPAAVPAS